MKSDQITSTDSSSSLAEISLQDLIRRILRLWWLFGLCIALCLGLAYAYLKYAPELYSISSLILIDQNVDSQFANESQFIDGGIGLDNGELNMYNEQSVLGSYTLIKSALAPMHLEVDYYKKRKIGTDHYYPCAPIRLMVLDSTKMLIGTPLAVLPVSDEQYMLTIESDSYGFGDLRTEEYVSIDEPILFTGTYDYGEHVVHELFNFSIEKNTSCKYSLAMVNDQPIYIEVGTLGFIANNVASKLRIELPDIQSSAIRLSLDDQNPDMAIAILDNLIDKYIEGRVSDQFEFLTEQETSIQNRIKDVKERLKSSENKLKNFQQRSNINSSRTTSENFWNITSELNRESTSYELAINSYQAIELELQRFSAADGIFSPSMVGVSDEAFLAEINALKRMTIDKKRMAKFKGSGSLEISLLNDQIEASRQSILSIINNSIKSLKQNKSNVAGQLKKINSKINILPESEKTSTSLQREFNLNDNLYQYLEQELAKIDLSKSTLINNVKILDRAHVNGEDPVAPNKLLIMALGGIIGLLIPMIIMAFVPAGKNTKQRDLQPASSIYNIDVDQITAEVIQERAVMGDKFQKTIRSFAQKIATDTYNQENNVVAATAHQRICSHGQVVWQVAVSLASRGHRVIFVDADFHNTDVDQTVKLRKGTTLNEYLLGDKDATDLLIEHVQYKNLTYISSDIDSDRSVKLIKDDKISLLLEALKFDFDYVIVNSAKSDQVNDNILLFSIVDQGIWICPADEVSGVLPEALTDLNQIVNRDLIILPVELV